MSTLSLLFFLLLSASEPFKGTVEDPSGGVIAGAKVRISRPAFVRETYTDNSGQFIFDEAPAGDYSIAVTAAGFAPHFSSISLPSGFITFMLGITPHGEDVLVTATRVETPLSMLGVSATAFDQDHIAQQQSPPLYELLREIPGMAVAQTSRRGGTTAIYTRGGGKNANLLLVDGIQVNDPGGDFNFAHLTSTNIVRVETVRGPQSAVYGSNAAASVIQVVSRQGTAEDGMASGFGSFEGGNFSTYRYRAGVSGAMKMFDYSLAAERIGTQGAYINDSYRNLTLAGNLGYRFNGASQVRFTLRTIGTWTGVPNKVGYGLLDSDASRRGTNIISGFRYEQNTQKLSQRLLLGFTRFRDYFQDNEAEGPFNLAAIVTGTPGARGNEGVRLVRLLSGLELSSSNYVVPKDARVVRRTLLISASAPSKTITERRSAGYQANWSYSSHSSIIAGYDFEQERGIANAARPLRNSHGLFANHQHSAGSRIFLTESVRLEDNSVFYKKVTPRFAASYLVTSTTRLKAGAGTGISEPSFQQNFAHDPMFVGNRNLRPERSQSVETGIERRFFGSRVVTEATLFANRFRDLIVFVSLPAPQPGTWVNLEASRARGIEWSTRLELSRLRLRGEYTFLDTRVTSAASPATAMTGIGQELPRRPRHSGAIDVTAIFRRGFITLNTTFVGERQDSDGVGFGIVRNPGYQRTDLGVSYSLRPYLDLFVRAQNLLNRRYEEVLGYTALSRSVLAGVTFRWRHR